MKIDTAHVLVDNVTKKQTLEAIDGFVQSGKPHQIVTIYSEFVVFANRDQKYLEILNKADLSVPDGIGILWAAKYLSINAPTRVGALIQIVTTGANIILSPSYIKSVIPEKVSGSKLIWDIAKLCVDKNYSMALVGGSGSVAAESATVLKEKFPGLRVNLALSGRPFDENIIREIADSNSDILCVAYQPPKQEIWIAKNLSKLNVKVAIGLGGTFDYLAGIRLESPSFLERAGLEWLWRLITQPWRIKRMWNAIPVFIWTVYKYKLERIYGKS